MDKSKLKLFAFRPSGHGQYSFFVMAADEAEAHEAVARYIADNFGSACELAYAGFGTDSYTLTVFGRGEVADNPND